MVHITNRHPCLALVHELLKDSLFLGLPVRRGSSVFPRGDDRHATAAPSLSCNQDCARVLEAELVKTQIHFLRQSTSDF